MCITKSDITEFTCEKEKNKCDERKYISNVLTHISKYDVSIVASSIFFLKYVGDIIVLTSSGRYRGGGCAPPLEKNLLKYCVF